MLTYIAENVLETSVRDTDVSQSKAAKDAPHSKIVKAVRGRTVILKRHGDVPQSKIYESGARRIALQMKWIDAPSLL